MKRYTLTVGLTLPDDAVDVRTADDGTVTYSCPRWDAALARSRATAKSWRKVAA